MTLDRLGDQTHPAVEWLGVDDKIGDDRNRRIGRQCPADVGPPLCQLREQIETGDQRDESKTVEDEDRDPVLDAEIQMDEAGQKRERNNAI